MSRKSVEITSQRLQAFARMATLSGADLLVLSNIGQQ
jgi:hypothetical protein